MGKTEVNDNIFYHKLVRPTCNEVVFAHLQNPEEARNIGLEASGSNADNVQIQYAWNRVLIQAKPSSDSGGKLVVKVPFNGVVKEFDQLIGALSVADGVIYSVYAVTESCKHDLVIDRASSGSRQEIRADIKHIATAGEVVSYYEVHVANFDKTPLVLSLFWFGYSTDKAWSWSDILSMGDHGHFFTENINFDNPRFVKGLLFDGSAINDVRCKLADPAWAQLYSHMETFANESMQYDPLGDHTPYLPGYDDRFVREREKGRRPYYWAAVNLAFVGLVNKDINMIKQAQLYLLCMLDALQWFSSAEETIPTSSWDARAFLPEMTSTSISLLWDWLGVTFKPSFTRALMRSLWRKGMSTCQGDLMAFSYMRDMNQGAVFCRPLVLGGLMLEGQWSMGGYVDDAYATMSEVTKKIMQQGGGAQEGPIYLTQFSHGVLWSLIAWNRARKKNWKKVVRSLFSDIPGYLESISQNTLNTYTPIGDSRTDIGGGDILPVLAGLMKNNDFLQASAESCVASGAAFRSSGTLTNSGGFLSLVYGPDQFGVRRREISKPVVLNRQAKKLRYASMIRDRVMSILVNGGNAGVSHSHEDAGSFVINIDDQAVICDPGMVSYENIETTLLKKAEYHNVLMPLNDDGHYMTSQNLQGGKEGLNYRRLNQNFSATITLDGIWDKLPKYSRKILAPQEEQVVIHDVGRATGPGKFAFSLVSPFTIVKDNDAYLIEFENGAMRIEGDWFVDSRLLTGLKDLKGQDITALHLISDEVSSIDFSTKISFEL